VDTPRRADLIAATHTLEEIRKYVQADTLAYLSLEGLLSAVGEQRTNYCTSCYTGQYPVEFPRDAERYLQLTLKLHGGSGDAKAAEVAAQPAPPALEAAAPSAPQALGGAAPSAPVVSR
jgi:hypothetical protein